MTEIAFVPAAQLKQHFHCYGYFYGLQLDDRTVIPCRSILELLDRSIAQPEHAESRKPDAIAVMMNPGSSRPIDGDPLGPVFNAAEWNAATKRVLVPTRPDTTQYQIMRIMQMAGWSHVRVLNLSDIREANSPRLFKQITDLTDFPAGDRHSIFSPGRKTELRRLVNDTAIPVIAGWGRSPVLEPLASQCRNALGHRRILGLPVPGRPLAYGHPSPRVQSQKLAWLETVSHQLSHPCSRDSFG